jgi:hypothetical protein
MKKVWTLMGVLVMVVAFGSGCATLGFKPSEDQLIQYEQNLGIANFTEAGIFVVFDQLCAAKTLDENSCVIGYAADLEWNNAYTLAMGAIADYRAGKTDQATMKKLVSEATGAALRIVALIKNLNASKPATAQMKNKAIKQKGDLFVPVGQTKGIQKK